MAHASAWHLAAALAMCIPVAMTAQQASRPEASPDDSTALVQRARSYLAAMLDGRFGDVEQDYDSAMHAALPPGRLGGVWRGLAGQVGALDTVGDARVERQGSYRTVVLAVRFARAPIDLRFTFAPDGQLAGLLFQPHAAPAAPAAPPPYVDRSRFHEDAVTVGTGEWALPATLALPDTGAAVPAVVLVHGSGPNDRDETIGPNKPFRDLAWGLASRGIAVLRYDKRTFAHGRAMAAIAATITVKEETVDDALAAVDLLRRTAGVDPRRIVVLGHSLGGTLVPRIGQRDAGIAGFIIMAGATRPLEDLIVEQTRYLDSLRGDTTAEARERLATLERQAARVRDPQLSATTPPSELPFGVPAAYWLDLRGYHPAREAASLRRPLLVMDGGRDYQVTKADWDGWRAALDGRTDATLRLYPSLNHLFMEGSGPGTPAEYTQAGHVSEAVIADITAWVHALQPAAAPAGH